MPTIRKRKAVTAIESAKSFWSIAIFTAVAIMRTMDNATNSGPGRFLVKICNIVEYLSQYRGRCTITIEKTRSNYIILRFAHFLRFASFYFLYIHFLIKEYINQGR
jgi:hypothetical protein